jgi:hypothetical protein
LVESGTWQPTTFLRYVRTVASSSRVALIHTDAGPAYLKATNNPQGAHVLACDWFGTRLAQRVGLRTFDVAVIELTESDEIPLDQSVLAEPGPAFVARAEQGSTMGGAKALSSVENIDDIARLIVFDTWVRNCDRYGPGLGRDGEARMNLDNLFLSAEGAAEGMFTLKAIDHGHVLTCGGLIDRRLANIDNTHDERLYGLFPFFRGYVSADQINQAGALLSNVSSELWNDLLAAIPGAWGVSKEGLQAIDGFLLARAHFLVDNLNRMVHSELNPGTLDFE